MIKRYLQHLSLVEFAYSSGVGVRRNAIPCLAMWFVSVAILVCPSFTQKAYSQSGGNGRWQITAQYLDYSSGLLSSNLYSTNTGGISYTYSEGYWYTGTQPSGGGVMLAGWAIIQYTWQPTNGNSVTDPPPTHLTVFTRKNITSSITVNIQGNGVFNISDQDCLGSDQIVENLSNIGQNGTYHLDSQGGQWGKADVQNRRLKYDLLPVRRRRPDSGG